MLYSAPSTNYVQIEYNINIGNARATMMKDQLLSNHYISTISKGNQSQTRVRPTGIQQVKDPLSTDSYLSPSVNYVCFYVPYPLIDYEYKEAHRHLPLKD